MSRLRFIDSEIPTFFQRDFFTVDAPSFDKIYEKYEIPIDTKKLVEFAVDDQKPKISNQQVQKYVRFSEINFHPNHFSENKFLSEYENSIIEKLISFTKNEKIFFIEYQIRKFNDPLEWLYSLERLLHRRSISFDVIYRFHDNSSFCLLGRKNKEETQVIIDMICEKLRKSYFNSSLFKIRTRFNIEDLSVFFNLFLETKDFIDNQTTLYSKASQYFTCIGTETPSNNSLKNSWNKLSKKTKEKWQKKLNQCIRIINKK